MRLFLLALASSALHAGTLTITFQPLNLVGAQGSIVYLDGTITNGTDQTVFEGPAGFAWASETVDPNVVQAPGIDVGIVFLERVIGPGLAPGASYTGHIFDFLIQAQPTMNVASAASVFLVLGPTGGPYTTFNQDLTITAAATPEPSGTVLLLSGLLWALWRRLRDASKTVLTTRRANLAIQPTGAPFVTAATDDV